MEAGKQKLSYAYIQHGSPLNPHVSLLSSENRDILLGGCGENLQNQSRICFEEDSTKVNSEGTETNSMEEPEVITLAACC